MPDYSEGNGEATAVQKEAAGGNRSKPSPWRRFPAGVQEASAQKHWGKLRDEVVERLVAPLLHPTFVLYLISGVLLLGSVPIALEWTKYRLGLHFAAGATGVASAAPSFEPVLTALHTFYPALAWSAAMQINFAEAKDSDKARKSLRALAFVLATVALLLSILLNAARPLFTENGSLGAGFVGVVLAVLLWWLANAKEQTYLESSSGDAAQGGDPSLPTEELAGGTEGFNV